MSNIYFCRNASNTFPIAEPRLGGLIHLRTVLYPEDNPWNYATKDLEGNSVKFGKIDQQLYAFVITCQ